MVPTSAFVRDVKTWVAVRRICVDPHPSVMFAGCTPWCLAKASTRAPEAFEYRPGCAPDGPNAAWTASSTALPGPKGFSLLDRMIGAAAVVVGVCADNPGSS